MSSFLRSNKISSKSNRQLKFLDKEKRNKLKEKISSGKQYYAKEFEQHFLKCYQLSGTFSLQKKTLFDAAVKMEHFVMFTELLLLHISDIFSECNRKSNKYAQFQMSWYTFSGKVLNYNTGIFALIKMLVVIKHWEGSASDTNGLEKYLGVTVNLLPSDQSDNFLRKQLFLWR